MMFKLAVWGGLVALFVFIAYAFIVAPFVTHPSRRRRRHIL